LSAVKFQYRWQLASSKVLLGDEDLAAIMIPDQEQATKLNHFYSIDEAHRTPAVGTEVGYLGYPRAKVEPLGENFLVSPCHEFGNICVGQTAHDPNQELLVTYRPGDDLDPHGFSGSGVWYSGSTGIVWSPQIRLAGLITRYDGAHQVLTAYRVEQLVDFLKTYVE
jgi:hypothetical protein